MSPATSTGAPSEAGSATASRAQEAAPRSRRRFPALGASFRRVLLIQFVAMMVGWAVWVINYWVQYTRVAGPDVPSLRSDLGLVAQSLADAVALQPAAAQAATQTRLRQFNSGMQDMLRMRTPDFGYVIWTAAGTPVLEQQVRAAWWPTPALALDASVARITEREGLHLRDESGAEWFFIRRVSADGRFIGVAAVRQSALDALWWILLRDTLLPTLWIFPFMLPTTWLIALIATAPVRRLARELHERDASDLRPLPEAGRFTELGPITRAANRWLTLLRGARDAQAAARERERSFFANAAHELRTPLAAIGAYTHALQQERTATGQADQTRTQTAAALAASVSRMTQLLDKLLRLARLDAEQHNAVREELDLNALVTARVAAFAPRAIGRQIQLALDAQPVPRLRGHRESMESLIDNLLENALRYTPAGGCVRVELRHEGPRTRLTVLDSGPGIAPAERERVFERFYRVRGNTEPGTGLGLSIVREAARWHGGEVTLDEGLPQQSAQTSAGSSGAAGHGLAVHVDLPAA
jgi:signal transduction histidine kinase